MKLEEYKKDYYYFSGEVSKLVIQFALAGIAVIWIFKANKPGQPLIPQGLLGPLICFVLSITFALLQYFIASIIWGIFYRYHERKMRKVGESPDVNVDADPIWPNIIWSFYALKVLALITGFVLLSLFIFDQIRHPKIDNSTSQPANYK